MEERDDPAEWTFSFDKFATDIVKREEEARKKANERLEHDNWGLKRDKALREHPLQRQKVK